LKRMWSTPKLLTDQTKGPLKPAGLFFVSVI
jgi:hypothetical protein